MTTSVVCRVCGHELLPTDSVCRVCRTIVPPDRKRYRLSVRNLWHVAVPIGFGLLVWLLPEMIDVLEIRLPLRTTPLVREALGRVAEDPRVVAVLGAPVRARWSVVGYIAKDETGWREGRAWVPVWGPKGDATLYVRAGRATGPWVFTTLEFRPRTGSVINFLDAPAADSTPVPRGPVYLVHLGAPRKVSLDPLRDYYRQHLGLDVTVLAPISLDPSTFDPRRRQFVGERLVQWMKRRFPDLASNREATVIGILEENMYAFDWNLAFSYRTEGRFGVVSSYWMTPPRYRIWSREGLIQSRVRKMVTKNIGVLVYALPLSSDPTSLLYDGIRSAEDLDLVQERFDGLGRLAEVNVPSLPHRLAPVTPELLSRAVANREADGRYPCFVVRPGVDWDGTSPLDARVSECLPGLRTDRAYDEFEVNLERAALVVRHTDLLVADVLPLVFTRCYWMWDELSRSFGVGWTHPYDILPVGSRNPYTYLDLLMPDGGLPLRFDRISAGTGYADAVYEHTASETPFRNSQIRWNGNGWDLRLQDGGLFLFPENYGGTKPHHGAATEVRDGQGHAIHFVRDGDRNLQLLTSPAGHFIRIEHDRESRVTLASDDAGHAVNYAYDVGGRLASVVSDGRTWRYDYRDTLMTRIQAPNGRDVLQVRYRGDAIAAIVLGDGRTFKFTFVASETPQGRAGEATVEAPDGTQTRVRIALPF
jgi:predicted Zn-dependent protease